MSTGRSVLALAQLIISSLVRMVGVSGPFFRCHGQERSLYEMQGFLRIKRFVHNFGSEFLHGWGGGNPPPETLVLI